MNTKYQPLLVFVVLIIFACLSTWTVSALEGNDSCTKTPVGVGTKSPGGTSATHSSHSTLWKGYFVGFTSANDSNTNDTLQMSIAEKLKDLKEEEMKFRAFLYFANNSLESARDLDSQEIETIKAANDKAVKSAKDIVAAKKYLQIVNDIAEDALNQSKLAITNADQAMKSSKSVLDVIRKAQSDLQQASQGQSSDDAEKTKLIKAAEDALASANKEYTTIKKLIESADVAISNIKSLETESRVKSTHLASVVLAEEVIDAFELAKTYQEEGEKIKREALSIIEEMNRELNEAPKNIKDAVKAQIDLAVEENSIVLDDVRGLNDRVSDIRDTKNKAVTSIADVESSTDVFSAIIHLATINDHLTSVKRSAEVTKAHVTFAQSGLREVKRLQNTVISLIAFDKVNVSAKRSKDFTQRASDMQRELNNAMAAMDAMRRKAQPEVRGTMAANLQSAQSASQNVQTSLNIVTSSQTTMEKLWKEANAAHHVVMHSMVAVETTENVAKVETLASNAAELIAHAEAAMTQANNELQSVKDAIQRAKNEEDNQSVPLDVSYNDVTFYTFVFE